jgi:hypothetical protein
VDGSDDPQFKLNPSSLYITDERVRTKKIAKSPNSPPIGGSAPKFTFETLIPLPLSLLELESAHLELIRVQTSPKPRIHGHASKSQTTRSNSGLRSFEATLRRRAARTELNFAGESSYMVIRPMAGKELVHTARRRRRRVQEGATRAGAASHILAAPSPHSCIISNKVNWIYPFLPWFEEFRSEICISVIFELCIHWISVKCTIFYLFDLIFCVWLCDLVLFGIMGWIWPRGGIFRELRGC